MNNWKKVIVLSGLCSCALSVNAMASTNLETGSSLAGISVALNNYYAGNTEPEKQCQLKWEISRPYPSKSRRKKRRLFPTAGSQPMKNPFPEK